MMHIQTAPSLSLDQSREGWRGKQASIKSTLTSKRKGFVSRSEECVYVIDSVFLWAQEITFQYKEEWTAKSSAMPSAPLTIRTHSSELAIFMSCEMNQG